MIASVEDKLKAEPKKWLVTGAAGFIGYNICEHLCELGQKVTGLDSFVTGLRENPEELKKKYPENFSFIEADIQDPDSCTKACEGQDYVLHNAALGSVPRSIKNPIDSHNANVSGTLNMFWAAHNTKVKKIVFASSSSAYGDHPALPKVEDNIGKPLSPYAATKKSFEVIDLISSKFCCPQGVSMLLLFLNSH